LASELEPLGVEIEVLPNYRRYAPVEPNRALRDLCGIADSDRVLLAPNNIVSGAEEILAALAELPDNVHLVVLGYIKPDDYRDQILTLSHDLGVADRLHLVAPVPYDELIHFAAGADIGLIILDPSIQNHRVSLPNRIFDLVAAELPVVTAPIPDIAKIAHDYDCGIAIDNGTSTAWADGIRGILDDLDRFEAGAAHAARALTWASVEPQLLKAFADADSVTFLHHRNLHHHQRTIRIATTLQQAGKTVRMATVVTDPSRQHDLPFDVIALT